jgi:hypothetical protein
VPKVSPLVVGRDDNLCTSFIPLGWTCSCWRATVKHGRSFQVASTDPLRCCPYCPDHRTSAGTEKQARKIPLNPGANQTFRPPLITKHPLQPCTSRSLPFLLSSSLSAISHNSPFATPSHPHCRAVSARKRAPFHFPQRRNHFLPPSPPLPLAHARRSDPQARHPPRPEPATPPPPTTTPPHPGRAGCMVRRRCP